MQKRVFELSDRFLQPRRVHIVVSHLTSGPFNFTYNEGHGEFQNPVSHIESGSENSKLLFHFQACPNVAGTESKGLANISLCFQQSCSMMIFPFLISSWRTNLFGYLERWKFKVFRWFVVPLRMKTDTDALCTRKSYQMVSELRLMIGFSRDYQFRSFYSRRNVKGRRI